MLYVAQVAMVGLMMLLAPLLGPLGGVLDGTGVNPFEPETRSNKQCDMLAEWNQSLADACNMFADNVPDPRDELPVGDGLASGDDFYVQYEYSLIPGLGNLIVDGLYSDGSYGVIFEIPNGVAAAAGMQVELSSLLGQLSKEPEAPISVDAIQLNETVWIGYFDNATMAGAIDVLPTEDLGLLSIGIFTATVTGMNSTGGNVSSSHNVVGNELLRLDISGMSGAVTDTLDTIATPIVVSNLPCSLDGEGDIGDPGGEPGGRPGLGGIPEDFPEGFPPASALSFFEEYPGVLDFLNQNRAGPQPPYSSACEAPDLNQEPPNEAPLVADVSFTDAPCVDGAIDYAFRLTDPEGLNVTHELFANRTENGTLERVANGRVANGTLVSGSFNGDAGDYLFTINATDGVNNATETVVATIPKNDCPVPPITINSFVVTPAINVPGSDFTASYQITYDGPDNLTVNLTVELPDGSEAFYDVPQSNGAQNIELRNQTEIGRYNVTLRIEDESDQNVSLGATYRVNLVADDFALELDPTSVPEHQRDSPFQILTEVGTTARFNLSAVSGDNDDLILGYEVVPNSFLDRTHLVRSGFQNSSSSLYQSFTGGIQWLAEGETNFTYQFDTAGTYQIVAFAKDAYQTHIAQETLAVGVLAPLQVDLSPFPGEPGVQPITGDSQVRQPGEATSLQYLASKAFGNLSVRFVDGALGEGFGNATEAIHARDAVSAAKLGTFGPSYDANGGYRPLIEVRDERPVGYAGNTSTDTSLVIVEENDQETTTEVQEVRVVTNVTRNVQLREPCPATPSVEGGMTPVSGDGFTASIEVPTGDLSGGMARAPIGAPIMIGQDADGNVTISGQALMLDGEAWVAYEGCLNLRAVKPVYAFGPLSAIQEGNNTLLDTLQPSEIGPDGTYEFNFNPACVDLSTLGALRLGTIWLENPGVYQNGDAIWSYAFPGRNEVFALGAAGAPAYDLLDTVEGVGEFIRGSFEGASGIPAAPIPATPYLFPEGTTCDHPAEFGPETGTETEQVESFNNRTFVNVTEQSTPVIYDLDAPTLEPSETATFAYYYRDLNRTVEDKNGPNETVKNGGIQTSMIQFQLEVENRTSNGWDPLSNATTESLTRSTDAAFLDRIELELPDLLVEEVDGNLTETDTVFRVVATLTFGDGSSATQEFRYLLEADAEDPDNGGNPGGDGGNGGNGGNGGANDEDPFIPGGSSSTSTSTGAGGSGSGTGSGVSTSPSTTSTSSTAASSTSTAQQAPRPTQVSQPAAVPTPTSQFYQAGQRFQLPVAILEGNAGVQVTVRDNDGDGLVDALDATNVARSLVSEGDAALLDLPGDAASIVVDLRTGLSFQATTFRGSEVAVAPLESENGAVRLTVTKETGWIRIEVDDPAPGQPVSGVIRSDGQEISVNRVFRDNGKLILIDDPEASYDVVFGPEPEPAPAPAPAPARDREDQESGVGFVLILAGLAAAMVAVRRKLE